MVEGENVASDGVLVSHQYVESKESMVVTLFELLATYGIQVCRWLSLGRSFAVLYT